MQRQSTTELVQELRKTLREDASLSADPLPRFKFRIGWFKNYDDLLSLKCESITEIAEIESRAVNHRRVLLHARGGGAKTVILHRLLMHHVPDEVLAIWVDLKKWTVDNYASWT